MIKNQNLLLWTTIVALCLANVSNSNANMPLNFESILTKKNNLKVSLFTTYENSLSEVNVTSKIYELSLTDGTKIKIPSQSDTFKINRDYFLTNIGAKYGISNNFDFGLGIKQAFSLERVFSSNYNKSDNTSYLKNIYINSNYQIFKKYKWLAESSLYSNLNIYDTTPGYKKDLLSQLTLGIVTLTVNDPIAISLSSEYNLNFARKDLSNNTIKNGDIISLTPSLIFVANDEISIHSSIGFNIKRSSYINEKLITPIQTSTTLSFGIAYKITERLKLEALLSKDMVSKSSSIFTIGITSEIGKLPQTVTERIKQLSN